MAIRIRRVAEYIHDVGTPSTVEFPSPINRNKSELKKMKENEPILTFLRQARDVSVVHVYEGRGEFINTRVPVLCAAITPFGR